ncbi:MAG TPA: hypothetical protein VG692_16365 [Gemmatimonadales bacterium]|nr:hypothetical protein [Gemmatimonadales bacterium]
MPLPTETASRPSSPTLRSSGAIRALRPTPAGGTPSPQKAEHRGVPFRAVFAVIGILLASSVVGGSYYFAPLEERARSPLHPWLRPSGYVGQTAGILSLLIFIFLWLYPLRKKYRWLGFTGTMARWLDGHVGLALILPFLAAVHASWRFEGVIGLGYLSMLVVAFSGIAGRYLYVHIPRSASGLELSAEEIAAERQGLIAEIAKATGLPAAQVETVLRSDPTPCEGLGILGTLKRMVTDDLARWRAARALRRACETTYGAIRPNRKTVRRVLKLARKEMSLTQQARMLAATQRLFRYWHVAHRPFAITALVAVLVHVGVVVVMGATWFW